MRKLSLLAITTLSALFIVLGCTKEGPEGPAGIPGPQGAPGNPGPPGAGAVTYSTWVTTIEADWVPGYLPPNEYNVEMVYNRTAPGLTQAILDQGIVLAYGKNFTVGQATLLPNIMPLPYSEAYNGQSYGYILSVGKITFSYDPSGGAPVRPVSQLAGIAYRYVLVPGTIAGGRSVDGFTSYQGYSADELRRMTYDQVRSAFNIPDEGTNIH